MMKSAMQTHRKIRFSIFSRQPTKRRPIWRTGIAHHWRGFATYSRCFHHDSGNRRSSNAEHESYLWITFRLFPATLTTKTLDLRRLSRFETALHRDAIRQRGLARASGPADINSFRLGSGGGAADRSGER